MPEAYDQALQLMKHERVDAGEYEQGIVVEITRWVL